MFFVRLVSSNGIKNKIELVEGKRSNLADGSERFLVDEAILLRVTENLGGTLGEHLKTTNVQNLRAMMSLIVRKN